MNSRKCTSFILSMNAVALLSLICLWYLKITSLPKLHLLLCNLSKKSGTMDFRWNESTECFLFCGIALNVTDDA